MASIEKLGPNKYKIVVSNGYRIDGSKIREKKIITLPDNLTGKQKEKELNKIVVEFENAVKNGKYLDGNKINLKEFIDKWEKTVIEAGTYAPSTWHTYSNRIHKCILPALGHLKIAKIQPYHILAFLNDLKNGNINQNPQFRPSQKLIDILNNENKSAYKEIGISYKTFIKLKNGNKIANLDTVKHITDFYPTQKKLFDKIITPLSNRTIAHYQDLLSTIFSAAVHWQIIEKNPVLSIEKVKVAKKDPVFFDDILVVKFLIALESAPFKYKMAIYLALDTGLRLSEVMGLKWDKVDEITHSINISEVRQYISEFGEVIKGPKSDSGNRNIMLSDTVFNMLMEYKSYQQKNMEIYANSYISSEFIITHEDGKRMFPNRPSVWLRTFLKSNNLPHVTFHGLRHTNASLLIAQNINPATLAERLGHSDKDVTLNIYTHAIKSKDKTASELMNNIYKNIN